MSDIQFQYPQALWLLAGVPVFILLYFGYVLWKRSRVKKIGDPLLVKQLYKGHSNLKATFTFIFLVLAYALGVVAVANPRVPEEGQGQLRKGIDIAVALDVSNSMYAQDVQPDRLTMAKQLIKRIIASMPDNRISIIVFAGNAYVQLPLTYDHGAARMYIDAANPKVITSQGTAINDALKKADIALSTSDERYKAVILISDGETHDQNAVETAKELAGNGFMINTVGVGSPGGATFIDPANGLPKRDASGQTVITALNEKVLQEIATLANGIYVPLTNTEQAANAIIAQLGTAEKRALVDKSLLSYHSLYSWVTIPMLIFLVLGIFFPDRKKVKA